MNIFALVALISTLFYGLTLIFEWARSLSGHIDVYPYIGLFEISLPFYPKDVEVEFDDHLDDCDEEPSCIVASCAPDSPDSLDFEIIGGDDTSWAILVHANVSKPRRVKWKASRWT